MVNLKNDSSDLLQEKAQKSKNDNLYPDVVTYTTILKVSNCACASVIL